ncbi:MAG TPA: C-type lectin domain-containing protein [Polyangiaceae bacterium]|nr:C-type lectin domain-containing protein [Polyangiaceae bacterium]
MVRPLLRGHGGRLGALHSSAAPRFVAAILFGGLLPGCPLSDEYFVDPNAAQGTGGSGDPGGSGGFGGALASGGKGGEEPAGKGGRAGPGGKGDGGTSAAGTGGTEASGTGGTEASGTGGTGGTEASGTGGMAGSSMKCEPMERCDDLDNDCNDVIDDGAACPASCSARQYDGHAYVLCVSSDDAVDADDAAMRCAEMSKGPPFTLELAWIESSDENEFLEQWIADTAPSGGVVWMGANDQLNEGVWVWGHRPDAEQFYDDTATGNGAYMDRFNYFAEGQPGSNRDLDEDCGAFDDRVGWHWSDRECSEAMVGYVCEQMAP